MLSSINFEKFPIFKDIIIKCINFCDLLDKNNLMDSRQRLNLMLSSRQNNPKINIEDYNLLGNEGKAYALFIKGLKEKDIPYY